VLGSTSRERGKRCKALPSRAREGTCGVLPLKAKEEKERGFIRG